MNTHWPVEKLEDVCDFKVIVNTELLPYVGMEDVESHTGKFLGSKEPKRVKSTTSYFDQSCVLYGKLRPYLNKVFIPSFKGHSTTEFVPMRPNASRLSREWLAWWLRSPEVVSTMTGMTTGSRMPRADMKYLKGAEIPLPSLQEQKIIVAKIESIFEKVNQAKQFREKASLSASELIDAELHDIFENAEERGWSMHNIGDKKIMKITSGGTPSRSNTSFYRGTIAWLKSGELNDNMNIIDSEEHISEKAVEKSSAKVFPENTVLLAMYGATAGKLGILRRSAATNQAVAGMICNEKELYYKFLFYALLYIRNEVVAQAWGGAQPNLSQTIIKKFQIPLPSLLEQKQITDRLDSLSKQVSQLRDFQEATKGNFSVIEQSVLVKSFQ